MRIVRAFACEFKCGQRVTVKRSSMARHEAQCIHNPAARSCPTCAHNKHEPPDDPDYETGYSGYPGGFFCAEDHLGQGEWIKKHCPNWKPKEIK